MRGKRSKQYRKLMQQYGLSFGFREPYQVLVDAEILQDADRFKMDLVGGLERTLHGQVKPMITQCSMRHLYAKTSEPGMGYIIDKAKLFERRRCNHLPEDFPEPLSSKECMASVVDPKGSKTNKHRYVVACQDMDTRRELRGVQGVPLVYINRSVMIMEPMAGSSTAIREREERGKFRDGLRRGNGVEQGKRKRDEEEVEAGEGSAKKKKKVYGGPKAPNPLAVKKSKKKVEGEGTVEKSNGNTAKESLQSVPQGEAAADGTAEGAVKRKRKRKHKAIVPMTGEAVENAVKDAVRIAVGHYDAMDED